MYGTVARVRIDPGKLNELQAWSQRMGEVPGQVARYAYQMDADPGEIYLVALFESKEAYWANANSPEQNERYGQMRALMLEDPEWHDGEIVDAVPDPSSP